MGNLLGVLRVDGVAQFDTEFVREFAETLHEEFSRFLVLGVEKPDRFLDTDLFRYDIQPAGCMLSMLTIGEYLDMNRLSFAFLRAPSSSVVGFVWTIEGTRRSRQNTTGLQAFPELRSRPRTPFAAGSEYSRWV
jgi:hypothetical protein